MSNQKFEMKRKDKELYDRYLELDFLLENSSKDPDVTKSLTKERNELYSEIQHIIESDNYELSMYRALKLQKRIAEYNVKLAEEDLSRCKDAYHVASQKEWRSWDYIRITDDQRS